MDFRQFYDQFLREVTDDFIRNNKTFVYKNANNEYIDVTNAFHSGGLRPLLFSVIDERRHQMMTGYPPCTPEDWVKYRAGFEFHPLTKPESTILRCNAELPDVSKLNISIEDLLIHTVDAMNALHNQNSVIPKGEIVLNNPLAMKKDELKQVDITIAINAFNEIITDRMALYQLAVSKPDVITGLTTKQVVNNALNMAFSKLKNHIPQENQDEKSAFLSKMQDRLTIYHQEQNEKKTHFIAQVPELEVEQRNSFGMER